MDDDTRTVRVNMSVDIEVPADLNDRHAEEAGRVFGYILADSQVMHPYALVGPHVGDAEPKSVVVTSSEVLDDEAERTEPLPGPGDDEASEPYFGPGGRNPALS